MYNTAPSRFFPYFIYSVTFLLIALTWGLMQGSYQDDAYISLRYARHLIDGQGLTWNPGERVEGYTNFLFIITVAALGKFGMDLVLASRVINLLAYGAMLIVFARYVRILGKNRDSDPSRALCGALAFCAIASSLPLLVWCLCGLETVFFACLVFCGVRCALAVIEGNTPRRDALLCGWFLALAMLTRPDAFIFALGILVFFGMRALARRREYAVYALLVAAAPVIILVPYMLWRFRYFGDWLPNTYYTKLYGTDQKMLWRFGLFYLAQFLYLPPLLTFFALAMLIIAAFRRALTPSMGLLALLVAMFMAYVVHSGGDGMEYFRFFVPVVPLLALLIYHGGLAVAPVRRGKLFHDLCMGLLFFSVLQLGLVKDGIYARGALSGVAVKEYIASHWPKGSLIALNPVGALPYYDDDYRYIDMLGLTDRHIAHEPIHALRVGGQSAPGHLKGDGKYVLSRRPDYIIFDLAWGSDEPFYLSDAEIAEQPEFKRDYKKMEVFVDPPPELLPRLRAFAMKKMNNSFVMNDKDQVRFIYYQRISKH